MSNYGTPSSADRRDTQPSGRTCAVEGCDTILSRYNKTDLCGIHADVPRSAQSVRTRVPAVLDARRDDRQILDAGASTIEVPDQD